MSEKVKIEIKYKFVDKGIENVLSGKPVLEDRIESDTQKYTLDFDKPEEAKIIYEKVIRIIKNLISKTENFDKARIDIKIRK